MKQLSLTATEINYRTCITEQTKENFGSKKRENKGNEALTSDVVLLVSISSNLAEVCHSLESYITSFIRESFK
jgi:hypothetical protein